MHGDGAHQRGVEVVKLPILRNDDGTERARLHPISLQLTANATPPSTASMVIPSGDAAVSEYDLIELYKGDESQGLFRVSGLTAQNGETVQVDMEHAIVTLENDITPSETELTGSPKAIAAALLGYQTATCWRLGSAPETGDISITVDESNVLETLVEMVQNLNDYILTFDFSTSPWKVSIAPLETAPSCECRLSRNTSSATITRDCSEMVTRVKAAQLDGGYMESANYKGRFRITRPLGVDEDAEAGQVKAYAQKYLKEHDHPQIRVEISAVELAKRTGESVDAFSPGKLCRIALADWNYTADQRLITVSYNDLVTDDENVTLTLSTSPRSLAFDLAKMQKAASSVQDWRTSAGIRSRSGGGGTVINQLEKSYTYSKDIDGKLTTFQNYVGIQLDEHQAQISLKASQSALDAQGQRLSQAEVAIDGANAAISLKASQTTVDALGQRVNSAEVAIDGANAEIALKVNKNGVISAINLTSEAATIQASKINLQGYVTASQLSAEVADINKFFAGTAQASRMDINSLTSQTAQITNVTLINYQCAWKSKEFVTAVSFPRYVENTIYYKNQSGNNAYMTVLTPKKNSNGSVSKTEVYYMGRAID